MQKVIEHQEMMLRNNLKLIAALQKEIESHYQNERGRQGGEIVSDSSDFESEIDGLKSYAEMLHQTLNHQSEESESLSKELTKLSKLVWQNPLNYFSFGEVEFQSKYSIPGYSEIRVEITDLVLANGAEYSDIHFKIVNKEGLFGIEIRENENSSSVVRFPDTMEDEFGKYLLVLSSHNFADAGGEVLATLSSDEVLLLKAMFEIASSKLFEGGELFAFDISDDEVRNWRKLCSQANFLHNAPLTYNHAEMNQYYEVDGYSHLAFELSGLMVTNTWFDSFFFKIATVDVNSSSEARITNVLRIELREQRGERPPLKIWPPFEEDEYGYKFKVDIPLAAECLVFETEELLSTSDYELLRQLLISAPSLLGKTNALGLEEETKDRWMLSLIDAQTLAQESVT